MDKKLDYRTCYFSVSGTNMIPSIIGYKTDSECYTFIINDFLMMAHNNVLTGRVLKRIFAQYWKEKTKSILIHIRSRFMHIFVHISKTTRRRNTESITTKIYTSFKESQCYLLYEVLLLTQFHSITFLGMSAKGND